MRLLMFCAALLLTSCAQIATSQPKPSHARVEPMLTTPGFEVHSCQKICTHEYAPVCATIQEGSHTIRQTFGNRCSVCSDEGRILHVQTGACEANLQ